MWNTNDGYCYVLLYAYNIQTSWQWQCCFIEENDVQSSIAGVVAGLEEDSFPFESQAGGPATVSRLVSS